MRTYAASRIFISLVFVCLINPASKAQLTAEQSSGINFYLDHNPVFSKYEKSVRTKVLSDAEVQNSIQSCWKTLKEYIELGQIMELTALDEMYNRLGTLLPEYRDFYMPTFNKKAYRNMLAVSVGMPIHLKSTTHEELLQHYYMSRGQNFSPENSFSGMIFQWPELVETLRSQASDQMKEEAPDKVLISWLENNYERTSNEKMRTYFVSLMRSRQNSNKGLLDQGCFSDLKQAFDKTTEKEVTTEQNWNGYFASESLKLKFERKGDYVFAFADNHLGSASETSQWNLSVTGGKAEGEWTVTYADGEKTIIRSGKIKLKLDGDVMNYDMVETGWDIKWKEGVKHYETEKPQIGWKMNGSMHRKQ